MVQFHRLENGLALAPALALASAFAVIPVSAETAFESVIFDQAVSQATGDKKFVAGTWEGHLSVAPFGIMLAEPPSGPDSACFAIRAAALTYQLPHPFLSRLIWQESRFNPKAVSPAGAIGIAQFMPATAQWRGLSDPFDPSQAIQHSARWLGELRRQFGNLGLAAAAYNAGPGRVQDWLANKRPLPQETRSYVRSITGRYPEDWIGEKGQSDEILIATSPRACQPGFSQNVATQAEGDLESPLTKKAAENINPAPKTRHWALQLIGDRSKEAAIQRYTELRLQFRSILGRFAPEVISRRVAGRRPSFWYQVRISEVSRERATGVCSRLKSAGGECLLVKN